MFRAWLFVLSQHGWQVSPGETCLGRVRGGLHPLKHPKLVKPVSWLTASPSLKATVGRKHKSAQGHWVALILGGHWLFHMTSRVNLEELRDHIMLGFALGGGSLLSLAGSLIFMLWSLL